MRTSLTLLLCLILAGSSAAAEKLRVLIVDGINNHDWPAATAWMQELLTASGKFEVDVSTTPPRGAPPEAWATWRPEFGRYAVVISNFNGGHLPDGVRWPHEVE